MADRDNFDQSVQRFRVRSQLICFFAVHVAVHCDFMNRMASGRISKGKMVRVRVTFRLEPDLAKAIKRAAGKENLSQADYVDSVLRPTLIKAGLIKAVDCRRTPRLLRS